MRVCKLLDKLGSRSGKSWVTRFLSLAFISFVAFGGVTLGQTATPHGIALTWTAPTTDANGNALPSGTVLTYDVWRATSAAGPFTQINSSAVTTTSYLDPSSGLTVGTSYTYEVTAIDTGGDGSPSNAFTITPTAFPVNPGAPSGCGGKEQ